jgi:hypothetical protein
MGNKETVNCTELRENSAVNVAIKLKNLIFSLSVSYNLNKNKSGSQYLFVIVGRWAVLSLGTLSCTIVAILSAK